MEDAIINIIRALGAPGVGLLMFAENLFPPLPSEFIMPLAAYLSSQGQLSLVLILIAGSIGSLLGTFFWYWVGRKAGSANMRRWIIEHGTWLGIYEEDLEKSDRFFEKHGYKAIFFGRLVPVVRTLISVPAGMSRMPVPAFLLYSTLGTVIWNCGLVAAGYLLGKQFPKVGDYLGPLSWLVIGLAAAAYLLRVYRVRRARSA